MAERRSWASYPPGDYDYPPASASPDDQSTNNNNNNNNTATTTSTTVPNRLERLRRALARTREQARASEEAERNSRWAPPPSRMRRRRYRDPDQSPPRFTRRPSASEPSSDVDLDDGRQRSTKRRKLNHSEAAFKYGHHGQVELGRLRLELESCDGEIHDERGNIYFGPENILKHDRSVYCSRASKCNLVLRHHDHSTFCLEKLYIIAPENGFTAPVKEGLIYVAMSRDELQPYINSTAQHHHYLNPPRSPPSRRNQDPVRLSLLESLHDPEVARAMTMGRISNFSPADTPAADEQSLDEDDDDNDNMWNAIPTNRDTSWPPPHSRRQLPAARDEYSEPCYRDEALDHPPGRPENHVVVLSDEDIDWPEDPTAAAVLADRRRRERNIRDYDDDDGDIWDSRFRFNYARLRMRQQHTHLRSGPPPLIPQADPSATDSVAKARFHIKDGRHRVAIQFDPPVSGTHILLKLQTPFMNKNIDIQTVMATGYAGPRYFPVVQYK